MSICLRWELRNEVAHHHVFDMRWRSGLMGFSPIEPFLSWGEVLLKPRSPRRDTFLVTLSQLHPPSLPRTPPRALPRKRIRSLTHNRRAATLHYFIRDPQRRAIGRRRLK